jgi:hypothetical protein
MKYTSLILGLLFSVNVLAGNEKAFKKAMTTNIAALNTARELAEFDPIANKFIRIGEAEQEKWLPYYYASLAYVWKGFRMKDLAQKDDNLLVAMKYINKAKTLEENNAEVIALEGFIFMMQISIDPGSRGQSITPKAFGNFNKALAIQPSNPRALLFKGQMQYGMSQFFGSGTEEACAMIFKSVELFEKDDKASSILPSWGRSSADQYIENCSPKENTEE